MEKFETISEDMLDGVSGGGRGHHGHGGGIIGGALHLVGDVVGGALRGIGGLLSGIGGLLSGRRNYC